MLYSLRSSAAGLPVGQFGAASSVREQPFPTRVLDPEQPSPSMRGSYSRTSSARACRTCTCTDSPVVVAVPVIGREAPPSSR